MSNEPIGNANHDQKGYGRQARLLLTMEYPPNRGGVGRYLESIVRVWPNHDINVQNAVFFKFLWPHWLKSLAIPFRENPSELWVSHVLPLGYVALCYKLLTGTPYTIFVHGTDLNFAAKSWQKRLMVKIILKFARQIIGNSHYTLSLLAAMHIVNDHQIVVYPCPTLQPGSQVTTKKPHSLLSVGRLVARKGYDTGIVAATELKKEFPDLVYTIIGNGAEYEKLQNIITAKAAGDYIKIITDADDEQLSGYYTQSNILLVPGHEVNGDTEGFGLVILEAAQFGIPAVATAIGGVGEAIISEKTGILISDNRVTTIATAVGQLLRDTTRREKMGAAAKQRADQDFKMIDQIKKIL